MTPPKETVLQTIQYGHICPEVGKRDFYSESVLVESAFSRKLSWASLN